MKTNLISLVQNAYGKEKNKLLFLKRIHEGHLTRNKNLTSHLCVYFPAFDPKHKRIFVGHHKKSGLWLCNGGHMEIDELPSESVKREIKEEWGITIDSKTIANPKLITVTAIENPEKQICQWHYDFWFFLPFDMRLFQPDKNRLQTEFFSWGWKTFDDAKNLFKDPSSLEALDYLRNFKYRSMADR